MKKISLFVVWLVCFTIAFNLGLDMLNESNTIANILGLFIVVMAIAYSGHTGCFYTFKKHIKENENEKDNQEN